MTDLEQKKALISLLTSVAHLQAAVESIVAMSPALDEAARCSAGISLTEYLERSEQGIEDAKNHLSYKGRVKPKVLESGDLPDNVVKLDPKRD